MVSFSRGVGVREPAPDPLAHALVPPPFAQLLKHSQSLSAPARMGLRSALRAASLGMIDHCTLRTRAIDSAVRRAVADGCEQVVILGAGLDTRAWRLAELADAEVYEVDHPSTQRYKQGKISPLTPLCGSLSFVAVDFATERFGDKLAAAGHDRRRPTLWIWEGVTMYLPLEAIRQTIASLSDRSAPGSELAVTYVVPGQVPLGDRGPLATLVFSQIFGEPLLGYLEPQALAELLAAAGFQVQDDSNSLDWSQREAVTPALARMFRGERLCIARKV